MNRLTNCDYNLQIVVDYRLAQHCGQVSFGSGVLYQQDETVIVIVGSIYIFLSILTIIGYAVYRSWFVRKPDYGNLE